MGIFLVCSKVCSEQFAFIAFYGLLQCDLKKGGFKHEVQL
jgi:hypothetical protein